MDELCLLKVHLIVLPSHYYGVLAGGCSVADRGSDCSISYMQKHKTQQIIEGSVTRRNSIYAYLRFADHKLNCTEIHKVHFAHNQSVILRTTDQ